MMGSSYNDWYETLTSLSQGAILRDTRIFEEKEESTAGAPVLGAAEIDAIVLTQTCDIAKPAQIRLLVAEVQEYSMIASERKGNFVSRDYRKSLIQNSAIAEFLIPPCSDSGLDWAIVNFRELHTVDAEKVCAGRSQFIGLASPYREHMSQAFGRFMMRVGLPATLHEFEKFKLS
ncbi:hypothetical protein [Nocardia carnea]|uniref:hypothetical protein n=1 Tax=Nocardia carnea TaxID=37328 RepID=UPI0024571622|nr:hypothetical protein [Nocardia carnea]